MAVEDEEPDEGEHDPGEVEGGSEAQQCPGPGEVDHWGEEIFEIPSDNIYYLQVKYWNTF